MAQLTSTTTGVANLDLTTLQATIDAIRARLNAGEVSAGLIGDLAWVYNNLAQHAHIHGDYSYLAYGNTAPIGTTYADRWTSAPFGAAYAAGPASQHVLYAPTVNSLVHLVNALRVHTHDVWDAVS
jgi:hypothetical protein